MGLGQGWSARLAADVGRDGLGLELLDAKRVVRAEVFKCDADNTVTVSHYDHRGSVPPDVLNSFYAEAAVRLGTFKDGPALPPPEAWRGPVKLQMQWLVSNCRVAFWAIYGMLGIAFLSGMHRTRLELLTLVGVVAASLFWCTLDAWICRKEFFHGLALPFFFAFPVSVAFYLVWTRGWRGLLSYAKAIALALAVGGAAMALRSVL
jgi:hypothetical protein